MIGIYDTANGSLLERCRPELLELALADWARLGYATRLGPAFPNLLLLYC